MLNLHQHDIVIQSLSVNIKGMNAQLALMKVSVNTAFTETFVHAYQRPNNLFSIIQLVYASRNQINYYDWS